MNYALSYGDFSIRIYRFLLQFFYKCMNIAISVLHMFPSMLALCLMLSMTHYAQNYAGIIQVPTYQ